MEECVICFEETTKFKFFDCNHKVCNVCYPKIIAIRPVCPLCNQAIISIIRAEYDIERESIIYKLICLIILIICILILFANI